MQVTIREPGSAITHFIAWLFAVITASPLIIKAGDSSSLAAMASVYCKIKM